MGVLQGMYGWTVRSHKLHNPEHRESEDGGSYMARTGNQKAEDDRSYLSELAERAGGDKDVFILWFAHGYLNRYDDAPVNQNLREFLAGLTKQQTAIVYRHCCWSGNPLAPQLTYRLTKDGWSDELRNEDSGSPATESQEMPRSVDEDNQPFCRQPRCSDNCPLSPRRRGPMPTETSASSGAAPAKSQGKDNESVSEHKSDTETQSDSDMELGNLPPLPAPTTPQGSDRTTFKVMPVANSGPPPMPLMAGGPPMPILSRQSSVLSQSSQSGPPAFRSPPRMPSSASPGPPSASSGGPPPMPRMIPQAPPSMPAMPSGGPPPMPTGSHNQC